MKIISQTPTELTLEARPIALWLIGAVLGLQGLFVIGSALIYPAADTLSCTRTASKQVNCQLTSITLFGQQNTRSIRLVKGAKVSESWGWGSKLARANLQTAEGEVKLASMPIWTAKFTVNQVNKFLASPSTPTLQIDEDIRRDRAIIVGFSLIWIASAFYLGLSPVLTSTFYKHPCFLKQIKQNLLGTKAIEQSISLPAPLEVKYYHRRGYRLMLGNLPISTDSLSKKSLENTAQTIQDFLSK